MDSTSTETTSPEEGLDCDRSSNFIIRGGTITTVSGSGSGGGSGPGGGGGPGGR